MALYNVKKGKMKLGLINLLKRENLFDRRLRYKPSVKYKQSVRVLMYLMKG